MKQNPSEYKETILALTALIILATILRWAFLSGAELSEFDPWRHLALIDNIRNGAGFTLFDGQPYIWYNAIWYHIAAMFGPAGNSAWLSAGLSIIALAAFFLFLQRTEQSLAAASAGGLMVAAYGPLITFTASYGSESFALLLVLLSLLFATFRQSRSAIIASGILFGIAIISRVTFIFTALLLLPLLTDRTSRLLVSASASLVIAAAWWHNHTVIATHPYLFTWDGLATRSNDFGFISTLVPQLHPAVAEATRTLYQQVAPLPLDFFSRGTAAWGNVVFLVTGICCVLATRRIWLIAATLAPLTYFFLGDTTLSTNFYRNCLALFPPLFIGIAITCERLRLSYLPRLAFGRFIWLLPMLLGILSGVAYLRPQPTPTLKQVTPSPEALTGERYMVNSGFYHPESLIRRYPGKKFIGMPLDPAQFNEFSRHYPQFTTIIWHPQFSVQEPLFRYLTDSGGYEVVGSFTSTAGFPYLLLEKKSTKS